MHIKLNFHVEFLVWLTKSVCCEGALSNCNEGNKPKVSQAGCVNIVSDTCRILLENIMKQI